MRRTSYDANHAEIVRELEAFGYSFYNGASVGGGASDGIVAERSGLAILVEIKASEKSTFYLSQLEYAARWVGMAMFATTAVQIRTAFKYPKDYCLTRPQKAAILRFVEISKRKLAQKDSSADWRRLKVSWSTVMKVIGRTK